MFLRCLLPALSLVSFAACATGPLQRTSLDYEPVTSARVEQLPDGERESWQRYLAESERLASADLAVLAAERATLPENTPAPATDGEPRRLTLERPAEWYASAEAAELAARVISYQTPAGGWNKANPYTRQRAPGEEFGRERRYRGTFDNGATITEIRFLARVGTAQPGAEGEPARRAVERGVSYLISAQYPNGGWPQVYPLTGDYHDAVTFNDDAIVNLLTLLRDISANEKDFAFVSPALRAETASRQALGLTCILRAQVEVDGRKTAWGQQHDALTLAPCAARAYEMASLSTAESAGLMRYLLTVQPMTEEVLAAAGAAAAWFRRTAIPDVAYTDTDGTGRRLVPSPGQGPLWARLYDLRGEGPVFGDRDRTVHASLETISTERRRGYAWYTNRPASALAEYSRWLERRAKTTAQK